MQTARKGAAWLWNLLPLPFDKLDVEFDEGPEREQRNIPLNKICDVEDWSNPSWRRGFQELGYVYDPQRLHRKEWEFTQGVYGLRKLRCLAPSASALGLGCGHEPIIYFLANRLQKVVATDLYEGHFSEREADPRILTDPEFFAPYSYPKERLIVRQMNATEIDEPEESFDIVFSFSSLEHFGSRKKQLQTLKEIKRVLRPGGIAVLTTEIILNRLGFHGDYFRRKELLDDLIPKSGLVLAGGDFSFRTRRETFKGLVRLPGERDKLPHLILRRWKTLFTSCALFLEKPISPGVPEKKTAHRGEEEVAHLPPLLRASIKIVDFPSSVKTSKSFPVTCRVANRGYGRWVSSAMDGIGHVRLGAHLLDGEGKIISRDYGRADLPGDMEPEDETLIQMILKAPENPGRYLIKFDMVREGAAWFSAREDSKTVFGELNIESVG